MKKFLSIILLLLLCAPLQASELEHDLTTAKIEDQGSWQRKLQRGFLNVVLSPFEISHHLALEKKEDRFPPGWLLGSLRGTAYTAVRALTGVYEIVTFPFPIPGNYAPITDPEFPMELLESPT